MSINVKKYTKEQMAKMVEEAQEGAKTTAAYEATWRNQAKNLQLQVSALKAKNATLAEQLNQMNGEAITRENVIANLKADADTLRNKLADTEAALGRANVELGVAEGALGEMDDLRTKLADTEAALGRANACIATMKVERDQQTKEIFEWQGSAQALHDDLLDARERANYAESHPWRNLWKWIEKQLKMA